MQYIVAIALLKGSLSADDYQDEAAKNPAIDSLRKKIKLIEDPAYSKAYLDAEKRAVPNGILLEFQDGTVSEKVEFEYPIGHPMRRKEGRPLLLTKSKSNFNTIFSEEKTNRIINFFENPAILESMSVDNFMDEFVIR